MKIALFGYGRMGKTIHELIQGRFPDDEVSLIIDSKEDEQNSSAQLKAADVAIEFSHPQVAFDHIITCFDHDLPVVVGTTAWTDRLPEAIEICRNRNQTLLFAPNFSLGVNLFLELNKHLARLINPHPDYKLSIEEIHHTSKLDAPSGTAIAMAESIIQDSKSYNHWSAENATSSDQLPISSKRLESVPGTHILKAESDVDSIEIKHTAFNREGFAHGAIVAAKWILGKKGYYQMKDVLNLHNS